MFVNADLENDRYSCVDLVGVEWSDASRAQAATRAHRCVGDCRVEAAEAEMRAHAWRREGCLVGVRSGRWDDAK